MSTAGTLYNETIQRGHMKLLTVATSVGGTTMDFVSGFSPAYDSYVWDIDDVANGGSAATYLVMRVSYDGGASFVTSGYTYYSDAWMASNPSGPPNFYGSAINGGNWDQWFYISTTLEGTAGGGNVACGQVHLGTIPSDGLYKHFIWQLGSYGGSALGYTGTSVGGGINSASAAAVTGVRFMLDTGVAIVAGGSIRMYGRRTGA